MFHGFWWATVPSQFMKNWFSTIFQLFFQDGATFSTSWNVPHVTKDGYIDFSHAKVVKVWPPTSLMHSGRNSNFTFDFLFPLFLQLGFSPYDCVLVWCVFILKFNGCCNDCVCLFGLPPGLLQSQWKSQPGKLFSWIMALSLPPFSCLLPILLPLIVLLPNKHWWDGPSITRTRIFTWLGTMTPSSASSGRKKVSSVVWNFMSFCTN